jgi:isocitrate/isopropylmalate dehydrogenase
MQFAFEAARNRPKKHLTVVTKASLNRLSGLSRWRIHRSNVIVCPQSNAQRSGLVLWDEVAYEVAKQFPDVKVDKMLVDAMTVRMTLDPTSLDTIVATNLHADILSDLAAALAGSIGIAPTGNLDPTRKNPSLFEPIHARQKSLALFLALVLIVFFVAVD